MKVILFGATGMVGQGVLRECLRDPEVERVLCVTRAPLGQTHDKLQVIIHRDFTDFSSIAAELAGHDACFFCLGVASFRLTEAQYHHITYDFTLAAAQVLARQNPRLVFIYVSGAGTDSSEKGRSMWARVKGKTENALLRLPFQAYLFRPGYIQPLEGVVSKTPLYRMFYAVLRPIYPVWKALAPGSAARYATTSVALGRAMLAVAKRGAPKKVLEGVDINAAAASA